MSEKEIGRSPHGERGLKFIRCAAHAGGIVGRSPHGERGLKSVSTRRSGHSKEVAPRMGSVD